MGIIIKARIAINSLLKIIFIAFLSVHLANMISMEQSLRPISYFLLLVGSMCVFENMVVEDLEFKTVDIRKAVILAVLLCLASAKPVIEFLYILGMSFIFFRAICILSMLCSIFFNKPPEAIKNNSVPDNSIPLLPCFAVSIVCICILMHINSESLFFQQFTDVLRIIEFTFFLPVYITSFFLLEITHYLIKKNCVYEAEEGLGMGDVLVLPSFAAFMGIPLFTITFILSLFLSIFAHIAQLIIRRNNNCH